MRQNLVAHCEVGSSDKIYMACIRFYSGQYIVLGKWGRRGKELQFQAKLHTPNESAAVAEQRRLFEDKLKKGYVDIESPAYRGSLTMRSSDIFNNLEGGLPNSNASSSPTLDRIAKKRATDNAKTPKVASPEPEDKEIIVECINNVGLEDWFDQGIEYVGETSSPKASSMYVFDKLGEKREVFKDRFKKVE